MKRALLDNLSSTIYYCKKNVRMKTKKPGLVCCRSCHQNHPVIINLMQIGAAIPLTGCWYGRLLPIT